MTATADGETNVLYRGICPLAHIHTPQIGLPRNKGKTVLKYCKVTKSRSAHAPNRPAAPYQRLIWFYSPLMQLKTRVFSYTFIYQPLVWMKCVFVFARRSGVRWNFEAVRRPSRAVCFKILLASLCVCVIVEFQLWECNRWVRERGAKKCAFHCGRCGMRRATPRGMIRFQCQSRMCSGK